jgi:hypothetical protein
MPRMMNAINAKRLQALSGRLQTSTWHSSFLAFIIRGILSYWH